METFTPARALPAHVPGVECWCRPLLVRCVKGGVLWMRPFHNDDIGHAMKLAPLPFFAYSRDPNSAGKQFDRLPQELFLD